MDEDISCMTNAVPVAAGTFKGRKEVISDETH